MLASMPSDDEINLHRHSSSIVDKTEWVTMTVMDCLEKSDQDLFQVLSKVRYVEFSFISLIPN